jgi:modification methylase
MVTSTRPVIESTPTRSISSKAAIPQGLTALLSKVRTIDAEPVAIQLRLLQSEPARRLRTPTSVADGPPEIPPSDNTPGAVQLLLAANEYYRRNVWPAEYSSTSHRLHIGDARAMPWVESKSVHLVVTSPPYWTLKRYRANCEGQLGDIADYECFLDELDKVWSECERVLVPGGRVCCVVGDVCLPRKVYGRHAVMPLHADIQVRARRAGLDCLTPILWQKIANGAMETEGNGAGFYGKPFQPGAIVKNDVEYILFMRKGGGYRRTSQIQKALSMLTKAEMQSWTRSTWTDVRGASTKNGHPAPFPVEIAERLIRMFSFAGDTVLDPFLGTGSTATAAVIAGRNSLGNEIDPVYLDSARLRLLDEATKYRAAGAVNAEVCHTNF